MSGLGFQSVVYFGDLWLGELEIVPVKDRNFKFPNNEIWIQHISSQSERCLPMAVLQTISPFSVVCKLQSTSGFEHPLLLSLHSTCFCELKTAVVLLGDEEVHLVAMNSKQRKYPCFWCYSVPCGLYDTCLSMLNARCLWIVFDLDETLIVANTMKTFRDRIKTLRSRVDKETDPIRKSGMNAEMKRCAEDQGLLKQYIKTDTVVDNGNVYKAQGEDVPEISESQKCLVRPVIRLPHRSIVLTRINPEIRDTSVLVRLRPSWEDLRRYLIAKGRKRFEVYVCTMAERDYALEMWRLLDPEALLIDPKQMLNRIVCVKSGARKSLFDVFQSVQFLPKMAMVIDDRIKVWDDIDELRVQVVPAFTPYYAPQAETATGVPVLCVARNIACNVRGCFFKEFDENLLQRISELFYEDEVTNLPSAPDVRNYLMQEGGWSAGHVNRGYIDSQLCGTVQGSNFLGPDSQNSVGNSTITSVLVGSSSHVTEVESKKVLLPPCHGVELEKQKLPQTSHPLDTGNQSSLNIRACKCEEENLQPHTVYVEVLQKIGEKCSTEVEFRSVADTSNNLQFCVEALFGGDKVGIGRGKTKKDAQQQAAENALRSLADKYISFVAARSGAIEPTFPKLSSEYEGGFFWDG